MPAWPVRQLRFQQRIDHLDGVEHARIIGRAQPKAHQRQGVRADDVGGRLQAQPVGVRGIQPHPRRPGSGDNQRVRLGRQAQLLLLRPGGQRPRGRGALGRVARVGHGAHVQGVRLGRSHGVEHRLHRHPSIAGGRQRTAPPAAPQHRQLQLVDAVAAEALDAGGRGQPHLAPVERHRRAGRLRGHLQRVGVAQKAEGEGQPGDHTQRQHARRHQEPARATAFLGGASLGDHPVVHRDDALLGAGLGVGGHRVHRRARRSAPALHLLQKLLRQLEPDALALQFLAAGQARQVPHRGRGEGGVGLVQVVAQLVLHLHRRLVAVVGLERHRLEDDLLQDARHLGVHQRGRHELALGDAREHLDHLALEGALPGDELVEQDAGREDVAAAVERLAARLLGREVDVLALHRPVLGLALARRADFGDAEVHQLDLPLVADDDVLGRDVAVHDAQVAAGLVAQRVGVVQPRADLGHDECGDGKGDPEAHVARPARQLRERLAVDVLHGQEVLAVDLAEGRVAGVVRQDPLDDHRLGDAGGGDVLRAEDLRHAARGDAVEQEVLAEALARGAGHASPSTG